MKQAREGKQKIRTWKKMVKELRKKFLPEGYLQEAFLQLHGFVQGNKIMADYTEELDHLMLKCGIIEPEEQTIARYLCGLRKEIHDVVTLQPFISYHDVFKLATKVEKQLKGKKSEKQRALVVAKFSIEAIQQAVGAVHNQPSQHQVQWPNFQPKPQPQDPLNHPLKLFNAIGAKGTVT
jgi:Retrotransposon gag protein